MRDREAHREQLLAALRSAEQWERAEHQRLRALPTALQIAAGLTWAPVRVTELTEMGRRVEVVIRSDVDLHEGIGPGERVRVEKPGTGLGVSGFVDAVDRRAAVLRLDDLPPEGPLSVTREPDAWTWSRYRQAVQQALGADTPLVRALLGGPQTEDPTRTPASIADPALNDAQREAAAIAVNAPHLAFIHGPPGTGKTHVVARVLARLVADGDRPWALADSNAAVDHLTRTAHAAGLDVVRVGPPGRISSDVTPLTLDARLLASPLADAIRKLDREISRLNGETSGAARAARRALWTDRDALAEQARAWVLGRAQVVATTFGSLVRRASELPRPITAVVDEATQAIEPAIWAAVPWVQRLVLVGDPHQLGPVVLEPHSPLAVSLLDRLVRDPEMRRWSRMLEVQHRMNAELNHLVGGVYGPRYVPHPAVAERELPGVARLRWVDTAGAGLEEAVDPRTSSTFNAGEVRIVAAAVQQLRDAGVPASEIGVIAPYSAQVSRLRERPELTGCEVDTVNAFQGREKDAIVVSFVRSNEDGELGFVSDRRRLTVAVTRARRAFVGVGDSATLCRDAGFADTLQRVDDVGGRVSVFEPPWDEALTDA